MIHEAGIEEAAETLVIEMSPDAPDMQAARLNAPVTGDLRDREKTLSTFFLSHPNCPFNYGDE